MSSVSVGSSLPIISCLRSYLTPYLPSEICQIIEDYRPRALNVIFLQIEGTFILDQQKTMDAQVQETEARCMASDPSFASFSPIERKIAALIRAMNPKAIDCFVDLLKTIKKTADVAIVLFGRWVSGVAVQALRRPPFTELSFSGALVDRLCRYLPGIKNKSLSNSFKNLQMKDVSALQESSPISQWLSAQSPLGIDAFLIVSQDPDGSIERQFSKHLCKMSQALFSPKDVVVSLEKLRRSKFYFLYAEMLLSHALVEDEEDVHLLERIVSGEDLVQFNNYMVLTRFTAKMVNYFSGKQAKKPFNEKTVLPLMQLLADAMSNAHCLRRTVSFACEHITKLLSQVFKQPTFHLDCPNTPFPLELRFSIFEAYKQMLPFAGEPRVIMLILNGLLDCLDHKEIPKKYKVEFINLVVQYSAESQNYMLLERLVAQDGISCEEEVVQAIACCNMSNEVISCVFMNVIAIKVLALRKTSR